MKIPTSLVYFSGLVLVSISCSCSGIKEQWTEFHSQRHASDGTYVGVPPRSRDGKVDLTDSYQNHLGIVEFDDQGELWDPRQLQGVKQKIASISRKQPLIVVTFAHGWENNSIPNNSNLRTLAETIHTINKVHFTPPDGRNPTARAYGVYLAWRGKTGFPIPKLDFYNRAEAAKRMGRVTATSAVYELGRAVREANPSSRHMLVGHSFGGSLIEEAINQPLAADIARIKGRSEIALPADLILTINAAQSSMPAKKLIDAMKARNLDVFTGSHSRPLIVSVTSEGDLATHYGFPAGGYLGRRFQFLNTGSSGLYRKYPATDPYPQSQGRTHLRTTGWNSALITHEVATFDYNEIVKKPVDDGYYSAEQNVFRSNQNPNRIGDFRVFGKEKYYDFKSKNGWNDSPYWVIRLPKSMCKDHVDIDNRDLFALFTSLLYQIVPAPVKGNQPEPNLLRSQKTYFQVR